MNFILKLVKMSYYLNNNIHKGDLIMEISINHGVELVINIKGRLDTVTSQEFTSAVEKEEIKEGVVVIEAKDLEYISSAGLRALLALKKSLASQNKELEIHHLNPVCQEVFKVTGFNNILTVK
ncbi:MAG: STAS domain-containing protein [Bacilli bacterium]|nr:STAS domain-containing protein [Bacilli bacterium]